ncbi:hypothetical protein H5410_001394 [Solanum commersonii]|uniref:Uncharacterized protein n=1 Tax=Solanum commersonii TaxID=4109 RepID=A0A9J6AYL5_SOLCO|nr:hypothetical protein H5410_001394 [Solanum commersonii]
MWNKAASCIREVASKVLEVSRGNFGGHKEDWWWNGEVQGKVEAKKASYTEWVECKVMRRKLRALRKVYKTRQRRKLTRGRLHATGPSEMYRNEEGKVLVDEISIKRECGEDTFTNF